MHPSCYALSLALCARLKVLSLFHLLCLLALALLARSRFFYFAIMPRLVALECFLPVRSKIPLSIAPLAQLEARSLENFSLDRSAFRLLCTCALNRKVSLSFALPGACYSALVLAQLTRSRFLSLLLCPALGRARVFSALSLENFSLDCSAFRLLCACAHFTRSLETSLRRSLCLAIVALRLCSLCSPAPDFSLSLVIMLCA